MHKYIFVLLPKIHLLISSSYVHVIRTNNQALLLPFANLIRKFLPCPLYSKNQQNKGRRSDVISGASPPARYTSCSVFASGFGFSGLRHVQFRWREICWFPLEYFLSYAIYNIYIHPFSIFPSPKSWAATYIPFALSLREGNLVYRIEGIHRKHGRIVRIAPNQLSFIQGEAWADVYGKKTGWRREFSEESYKLQTVCLVLIKSPPFFFIWRIWFLGEKVHFRDANWHSTWQMTNFGVHVQAKSHHYLQDAEWSPLTPSLAQMCGSLPYPSAPRQCIFRKSTPWTKTSLAETRRSANSFRTGPSESRRIYRYLRLAQLHHLWHHRRPVLWRVIQLLGVRSLSSLGDCVFWFV